MHRNSTRRGVAARFVESVIENQPQDSKGGLMDLLRPADYPAAAVVRQSACRLRGPL